MNYSSAPSCCLLWVEIWIYEFLISVALRQVMTSFHETFTTFSHFPRLFKSELDSWAENIALEQRRCDNLHRIGLFDYKLLFLHIPGLWLQKNRRKLFKVGHKFCKLFTVEVKVGHKFCNMFTFEVGILFSIHGSFDDCSI